MRPRTAAILWGAVALVLLSGASRQGDTLPQLKKELLRSLNEGNANAATGAIKRIADLNTREAVEFLVARGLRVEKYTALNRHGKLLIFDAARKSLSRVTDPEAREYLFAEVRLLKKVQHSPKKVFLTEVIGHMKGEAAEKALIPLLGQDKFPAVQMEAIEALARRRSALAVDPFIRIVERREKNPDDLWKVASQGLVQITGYSFPTAVDWRNFWAIRKDTFDPKKDRGEAKPEEVRTKERNIPTFFDEDILAKRPIFVIDISKSMHVKDPAVGGEKPRRKPGEKKKNERCPICGDPHRGIGLPASRMRVERVKRELVSMIENLRPDRKFNILAFSTEVLPWTPGDELVQATEKNKAKAIRFVQGLTFEEYTSTDYALERAFAHRDAGAIFLLSDGTPYRDREPLPPKPILEAVRMENKTRKVKVYTFGFSADANKDFLEKLAGQNGGKFKAIK